MWMSRMTICNILMDIVSNAVCRNPSFDVAIAACLNLHDKASTTCLPHSCQIQNALGQSRNGDCADAIPGWVRICSASTGELHLCELDGARRLEMAFFNSYLGRILAGHVCLMRLDRLGSSIRDPAEAIIRGALRCTRPLAAGNGYGHGPDLLHYCSCFETGARMPCLQRQPLEALRLTSVNVHPQQQDSAMGLVCESCRHHNDSLRAFLEALSMTLSFGSGGPSLWCSGDV